MKPFCVLFLLLLCGCSDSSTGDPKLDAIIESAVEFSKLQERNGLMYLPDRLEPFNGYAMDYADNDSGDDWLSQWKDGKQNGLSITWSKEGYKTAEATFKDGKEDGWVIYYYEDGSISAKTLYKDGVVIEDDYQEVIIARTQFAFPIGLYPSATSAVDFKMIQDRGFGLFAKH